eukprot:g4683.t1
MSHQILTISPTQRTRLTFVTHSASLFSRRKCSRRSRSLVVSFGVEEESSGESLASEFSQYLLENEISNPQRSPSHLMSPVAVVSAQMNALQRNNWPENDSGIKTAFEFTKPWVDSISLGDKHVRTWFAEEKWLSYEEFTQMIHSDTYSALIDFDEWKSISELVFPSRRKDVAVQAVKIKREDKSSQKKKEIIYTFCLERILQGSYHVST